MSPASPSPLFLFIVPTLNSLAQLPTLVASLRAQTWPHWRVLMVDGGSGAAMIAYLETLCAADPRFGWQVQSPEHPGIFGAMNQGMAHVAQTPAWREAWLLFWGSDDWAAAPRALERVALHLRWLQDRGRAPHLLVCGARYARLEASGQWRLTRRSVFRRLLSYRASLRLGLTPPHQGTLFSPKVRQLQPSYAERFQLSADLDYFLRLSRWPELEVDLRSDIELVVMAEGGASGQRAQRRFREVRWAYQSRYGRLWWCSYGLRYLKRGLDAALAPLDRFRTPSAPGPSAPGGPGTAPDPPPR